MQKNFLEDVIDKMIAVYEVDYPGHAKYSVGYFAVNPEDLLGMVHTNNSQEEEYVKDKVEGFKKAFANIDLADETNVPPQVCPMIERVTNDISFLDNVFDVPVINLGYCVHQNEATVGMNNLSRTFLINYRGLVKKGIANAQSIDGEPVYNGPKVDKFISEGNRGALAKEIRNRYDTLYGFHMTNQEKYKSQAAAAIRGFFAGTPLLALAEEMISVVEKMDPKKNGSNRPLERLSEQYIPLLTATAFEDYKGAAEYKKSIEEMKRADGSA